MLLPFLESGRIEAGCDEAGRGCLAGPVFAAAVKSEVYGSGTYENPAEKLGEILGALEERYGKLDFLSNEEKAYIDTIHIFCYPTNSIYLLLAKVKLL